MDIKKLHESLILNTKKKDRKLEIKENIANWKEQIAKLNTKIDFAQTELKLLK